jgi:hypothetical protein
MLAHKESEPMTIPPMHPNILGTYRGYTLRRDGTSIIAVKYATDAQGNTSTLHRLTGDFDNTIAVKNAIDAMLKDGDR